MAKKRVFISFDVDHDEGTKKMLALQAKLQDSPFDFIDASVKEPLTGDWKEKVRRRMANIDLVIALCGEYTHTADLAPETRSRRCDRLLEVERGSKWLSKSSNRRKLSSS